MYYVPWKLMLVFTSHSITNFTNNYEIKLKSHFLEWTWNTASRLPLVLKECFGTYIQTGLSSWVREYWLLRDFFDNWVCACISPQLNCDFAIEKNWAEVVLYLLLMQALEKKYEDKTGLPSPERIENFRTRKVAAGFGK